MRSRFDQFAKQILATLLEDCGEAKTEYEVLAPDPQRIDFWFVPDAARVEALSTLGLLGRIAAAPFLLEAFHQPPTCSDVLDCLRKQLTLRHRVSASTPAEWRAPSLWVVSSGRPESVVTSFALTPRAGWPSGVYTAPTGLNLFVIVASELPADEESLILRLMGARAVLTGAVRELCEASGFPHRERLVAQLVILGQELRGLPVRTDEEEHVMLKASELLAQYEAKAREEGQEAGREQAIEEALAHFRRALVSIYESRHGTVPDDIRQALEATRVFSRLESLAAIFAVGTREEIANAVSAG